MPQTRTNGEGTIYKRKDGRWEGAVFLPTQGGMRKRFRVYAATRREAHERLTQLIDGAREGILQPDRVWRLDEYLDFWLDHEKRRPLTRRRHELVVRLHIKPYIGRQRLNALTVRSVQAFLDELHTDGRTIATVHQVRKVLSAALTYAMRQEMLTRNVARLVELPRYKAKEAAHWTPDETARFLDTASTDVLYPVFLLLALYGLRRGEAIGIRWRDVDFDQQVLRIRQQIQRIDGQLLQVELKTDTSERDEPLLDQVRAALLHQHDVQARQRAAAGDNWQGTSNEDELVFTTRTGRPLESHNLERSFKRICSQTDLRRITIHGLRHSNATTQKSLDIHSRDIQAILGHGDIRTTGIYEHVDLASKRNALQRVESRLFATPVTTEVRCRQTCRQTSPSSSTTNDRSTETKTPTPDGMGVFVGGSYWTRTSDTRLFRAKTDTLQDRLTSINAYVRTRATAWKIGCIAVNFAVRSPALASNPGVVQ